ncbi:MAG: hypothetical protein GXP49_18075 [Deltaproteobacteria bacterium]|nr:hypothetical protein [Deltaproteobacteria bacterium]
MEKIINDRETSDSKTIPKGSSRQQLPFQAKVAEIWRSTVDNFGPKARQASYGVNKLIQRLDVGQSGALKAVEEFSQKIIRDGEQVERRIQNGVRTTMTRFKIVASDEMHELSRRVDVLGTRLGRRLRKNSKRDKEVQEH